VSVIVYGYLHQGGMIPAMTYVQKMFTHVSNIDIDQHVIFYHTYMPPRYLLMAPISANLINNKRYIYEMRKKMSDSEIEKILQKSTSKNSKNTKAILESLIDQPMRSVYDLPSSSNLSQLEDLVFSIRDSYINKRDNHYKNVRKSYAIFLVAPSIEDYDLNKNNQKCSQSSFVKENLDSLTALDYKKLLIKRNYKTKAENNGTSILNYDLAGRFRFHITFDHLNDHFATIKCKLKRTSSHSSILISEIEKDNFSCNLNRCRQTSFFKRFFDSFSLNLYQILL
jgi:hypothetical protein